MQGQVAATFVYPIKGLRGVKTFTRGIRTSTTVGVVGNRNFAIRRKADVPSTGWKPKGHFKVCMNHEDLATKRTFNETDLNEEYRPTHEAVFRLVRDYGLLGKENALVDTTGSWHLADTNKPYVSFLNLASVRDLALAIGVPIDPRRFRMDVWVDGLPPWCELDYIKSYEEGAKYPMVVDGRGELHIDDVCIRCQAIEQNPVTGKWDLKLQNLLGQHLQARGYTGLPERNKHVVMGWLAIPQDNFAIHVHDTVRFTGA